MSYVKSRRRNPEKGIALFIAMFALMLLSAVGLAMVFSADTETSINANYRDQQTATYAALSGLQEARDRLVPGADTHNPSSGTSLPYSPISGALAWPNGLPSTSAANVIYILNPANSSEVVAPWDPTNPYYDWEICSTTETMPTGFCTGNAPTSTSGWYTTVNNRTDSNVWHRTVPLDFKWVRVNLKTDNMAHYVPIASSVSGKVACWSGSNQLSQPNGWDATCSPDGSLQKINLVTGMNVFTTTPTVTIAPPPTGGVQAVAHAIVTSTTVTTDTIQSITLTNPGSGYTSAPTISFNGGGGGTGAAATAQIATAGGKPVASVSVANASAPNTGCYASPLPLVSIAPPPGGVTALATASWTGQTCIASWSVTGACSAYKGTTQNVGLSGGGGSGFAGTITFKNGTGGVTGFTLTSPGSGYSSIPTTLTGISGCALTVTPVLGYQLSSISVTNGGNGYATTPAVSLGAVTSGTAPTLTATLGSSLGVAGTVTGITLTNAGSGYNTAPNVQINGGGGSGATAIANMFVTSTTTYTVTGFDFSCSGCTPGKGYTGTPAVLVSDGTHNVATTALPGGPTYYGQVFQLTSFAQTHTLSGRAGSLAMVQEEVATGTRSPFQFAIGGAITIPGPNPNFGTPNSNNFYVDGRDANSCGTTAVNHPSIDVYDPTVSDPTAQNNMVSQLARPDHYPGLNATPDVEVGWGMSTPPNPLTLKGFVNQLYTASATSPNQQYISPGGGASFPTNPSGYSTFDVSGANAPITFVAGNATVSGNTTGSGILVVTGTLTFSGNYTWNGLILVIGQGNVTYNGGGSGQVNGSLYVAKTYDTSGNLLTDLGSPTLNYSGGGGNGVHYDHCEAETLLGNLAQTPPGPNQNPLTVISQRTVYKQ